MTREAQDAFVAGLLGPAEQRRGLTLREQALLAYADVLTMNPAQVTGALVDTLRVAGCDDRAIHDACAIIGYFAFVNRIADGLGVELENNAPSADIDAEPD